MWIVWNWAWWPHLYSAHHTHCIRHSLLYCDSRDRLYSSVNFKTPFWSASSTNRLLHGSDYAQRLVDNVARVVHMSSSHEKGWYEQFDSIRSWLWKFLFPKKVLVARKCNESAASQQSDALIPMTNIWVTHGSDRLFYITIGEHRQIHIMTLVANMMMRAEIGGSFNYDRLGDSLSEIETDNNLCKLFKLTSQFRTCPEIPESPLSRSIYKSLTVLWRITNVHVRIIDRILEQINMDLTHSLSSIL